MAVRVTSAPVVVVRVPVQVVLTPGSREPAGVQVSVVPSIATVSGVSVSLPVLVTVAL